MSDSGCFLCSTTQPHSPARTGPQFSVLPCLNSWLRLFLLSWTLGLYVHEAQLWDVLVGVSKPPLIVVSGAGPLAGFGSGDRLMWKGAGGKVVTLQNSPSPLLALAPFSS